mmetsp:Transcript_22042/g.68624  ORF Transcript_22042/g.68624 Transcript_22042/m.68624 type:complete len:307 (+) Transcript_22042:99-1019(+)
MPASAGGAAPPPSVGEGMRCLWPLCGAGGLAVGVAAASVVNQRMASLTAAAFFIFANLVPDSADEPPLLGLISGLLGSFMGYGLGTAGRVGLQLPTPDEDWAGDPAAPLRVPLFLFLVTIFHAVEFIFTALFHPSDVEFRAFLLTPVPMGGYSVAMVAALAEFWTRGLILGHLGSPLPGLSMALLVVGSALALGGWALRALALFTARSNFTHLVAWQKAPSHRLVQHGVYRLCRHPGYVGWFLWSVSTQLVLGNPLCLAAYFAVSWRFFAGRIPGEEAALVHFFGEEYLQYARRVPCGIPGISRLP